MSEREPDDTPKTPAAPQPSRERRPGDYYYDDATGYEVYDPAADEEDEEESPGGACRSGPLALPPTARASHAGPATA